MKFDLLHSCTQSSQSSDGTVSPTSEEEALDSVMTRDKDLHGEYGDNQLYSQDMLQTAPTDVAPSPAESLDEDPPVSPSKPSNGIPPVSPEPLEEVPPEPPAKVPPKSLDIVLSKAVATTSDGAASSAPRVLSPKKQDKMRFQGEVLPVVTPVSGSHSKTMPMVSTNQQHTQKK